MVGNVKGVRRILEGWAQGPNFAERAGAGADIAGGGDGGYFMRPRNRYSL